MKMDVEKTLKTTPREKITPNPSEQATTSEESRKKEMSTMCECIYEFEIVSSFLEKKIPVLLCKQPLGRKSKMSHLARLVTGGTDRHVGLKHVGLPKPGTIGIPDWSPCY